MQQKPLPLRVAVVQLRAHLAFEGPRALFLKEPLEEPYLSQLHDRLPPDSPLLPDIERLQQRVARAYDRGFFTRLEAILSYCASHGTQLVVFPEYSIPGSLLPQLRQLAAKHTMTIVAGTHLVTDELLGNEQYRECFKDPPTSNYAIAPVIPPSLEHFVRFQLKLWRSQWEPDIEEGFEPNRDPEVFKHNEISFGVAICIDFIRNLDEASLPTHQKWSENHLLLVASATPGGSPRTFEALARSLYQHFHMPVAYANLANDGGGSFIEAFGKEGVPLGADTDLPPLPARHEGICIAELRLDRTAKLIPTPVVEVRSVQPLAYALIQKRASNPELASAAEVLASAGDSAEFKRRCDEFREVLASAARQHKTVDLVRRRWECLAKRARGVQGINHLKRLASDLWLPDDILSLSEIERALARGATLALDGLIARNEVSATDRQACISTRDFIEQNMPSAQHLDEVLGKLLAKSLIEEVLTDDRQDMGGAARSLIHADGSVEIWNQDPGPPPKELVDAGFKLSNRASLDSSKATLDASEPSLINLLPELDTAATWLAIQGSPPSWIGWSPNETPALVVAPGHVVLVATLVPPTEDLRLARTQLCKPLPIALLLGNSDGLAVTLPSGVVPLDKAIRRLAIDEEHLRFLAAYELTPEYRNFVDPRCEIGFRADAPKRNGLAALNGWLESDQMTAVLCGAIGDGRTTLLRMWLVGLAQDALLREGLPVLYVDGSRRDEHRHISSLVAPRSPERLAALRLAIFSGDCLLVLDGFDDILPGKVDGHPFFHGWLTDESTPMLLHASCWRSSAGALICMTPQYKRAEWVLRTFNPAPANPERIDNPPWSDLNAYVTNLVAAFDGSYEDGGKFSLLDFLEDLAHALWSIRGESDEHHSVTESELWRHGSRFRPDCPDPRTFVDRLREMHQFVIKIEHGPVPASKSPSWKWWRQHAAFRTPPKLPPSQSYYDTRRNFALALPWDALLHFLIADKVVRALSKGATEVLDPLPFHAQTVVYCHAHAEWPSAREALSAILADEAASPPSRVNALILAATDPSPARTASAPWRLASLDLRCLDLDRAMLDHADLKEARLSFSSLRGASLRGADLSGADLEGCDLSNASLAGAKLHSASFSGSILNGTAFDGADLTDADLSRSNARENAPHLSRAILSSTRLHAIDWAEVPLSVEQASAACTSWSTPIAAGDLDDALPSPLRFDKSIAWSQDDHLIATGDAEGQLWLWSGGPVRCLALLKAHKAAILAIAFSPDHLMLATSGADGMVRIWRRSDLSMLHEVRQDPPATGLRWEGSEHVWIFAGAVRRWSIGVAGPELPASEILQKITEADDGVLSKDGRYLVIIARTSSEFASAIRYDLHENRVVAHILGHPQLSIFSLDPQLHHVAVADREEKLLKIVRLEGHGDTSATITAKTRRHPRHGPMETWSSDGGTLAFLYTSKPVTLWDRNNEHSRTLPDSENEHGVIFAHHQHRLLLSSPDHIRVCDAATGSPYQGEYPQRRHVHQGTLAWTDEGLRIHNQSFASEIRWHSRQHLALAHNPHQESSSTSPTGNLRLTADTSGFVLRHQTQGAPRFLQRPGPWPIAWKFRAWSPDESLLAINDCNSERVPILAIWNTNTGEGCFRDPFPASSGVLLARGGVCVPMLNSDEIGQLDLLDLSAERRVSIPFDELVQAIGSETGEHVMLFGNPRRFSPKRCLRAIPTQRLMSEIAGLAEGEVKILDASSCTAWERAFTGAIESVAFDRARNRLAAACEGMVRILQLDNGADITTLPIRAPMSLAFAPNGAYLAAAWPSEIAFWSIERAELLARLVLLQKGAVLIRSKEVQRLADADGTLPSLDGFYGRAGVHLWPLDRLADLESTDLCAELWRTFTSTSP